MLLQAGERVEENSLSHKKAQKAQKIFRLIVVRVYRHVVVIVSVLSTALFIFLQRFTKTFLTSVHSFGRVNAFVFVAAKNVTC